MFGRQLSVLTQTALLATYISVYTLLKHRKHSLALPQKEISHIQSIIAYSSKTMIPLCSPLCQDVSPNVLAICKLKNKVSAS